MGRHETLKQILTSVKTAAVYATVGILWIVFSDRALLLWFRDAQGISEYQTYKGWFFVLSTSVLVYALVRRATAETARSARESVERERAKLALRECEDRFRVLVEQAADGLFLLDMAGKVVDVNPSACKCLGYKRKELLGKTLADIDADFDPQTCAKLWADMSPDVPVLFCSRYRRHDGSTIPVEMNIRPMAFNGERLILALARNITERQRTQAERDQLQAELRQAQKMEAIGRLAAGVAHDFNNILTTILGNAELITSLLDSPSPKPELLRQRVQEIERGAERAARLTGQLLAFSRRQVTQPKVLNLNDILSDLNTMLQRLLTEDITMTMDLAPDLHTIRVDQGQIEQVILNLVVNAADAMPDGGKLHLQTRNVNLDHAYLAHHANASLGPHALLIVSDTGTGMDEATLDRIYEPFFTTKNARQGTGLGLATVHGVVLQTGGHIRVRSELGQGTTFEIYLPAAGAPSVRPSEPTESAKGTDREDAGTETILLCEDDDTVRELVTRHLSDAGYLVLAAESGEAAVQLASRPAGHIDLLVTDVIMPNMNGRQLADALQAIQPGLRTLYISGYTADVIAHHGVLEAGVEFLEKPFSRAGLLRRVREVLTPQETKKGA